MNDRQPYEKHLADKLQHLPPPGEIDQSWEQMRALLEKEMPRGGAMPGRRNWWLFGIAIGILFLATWLSGGTFLNRNLTTADKQTLPPAQDNHENNPTRNGNTQSRGEPGITPAQPSERDEGRLIVITPKEENKNNNNRIPTADETNSTLKNNRTANKNKNNNLNLITPDEAKEKPAALRPSKKGPATAGNTITSGKSMRDNNRPLAGNNQPQSLPQSLIDNVQFTLVQPPPHYPDKPGPVLAPGTIIEKDYARKSARLPAPPKEAAKKKIQKSRAAGTFAVGFTLPLAFPLGDQRAMGYNLWAGHNTVSDYLPSPHLQYHLNDKTFLQTEAQLMSPQFIRSNLLFQTVTALTPGYYATSSVFAKKLYYFNVPVSIHHSPFPGFYMGTGLQFSSMISGVALTEEKRTGPGGSTIVKETYTRFKSDSISQRIDGSEFRVMLDANYLFNRFTVGLRYNQALSNYISFRIAPGAPYSFEKNRALQFYMRYNLWEERKRATNKSMLTLK